MVSNLQEDSYSRYIFKKKLSVLRSKEGRGTELISLYIPPNRNIFEVTRYLRKEYDQAGNIKDKSTRKNVQAALESLLQRLKLYRVPPENGIALFCGAIPRNKIRGTEKIELYEVIPPEPIRSFIYRCDQKFFLEPLMEMTKEKESYGLIVMDRGGGHIALIRGSNYKILDKVASLVPPKHSAGGQSQRRFERLREVSVIEFYKKLGEHVNKAFLPLQDLKGIIVGGPGDAKREFIEGDYVHYSLKKKVIALVNLSYTGESGVRELVWKASSIISDTILAREKQVVEDFLKAIINDPDTVVYGRESVENALKMGAVEKILILDNLNLYLVGRKCLNCGYSETEWVKAVDIELLIENLSSEPCPQCGSTTFEISEPKDIVEYMGELAENYGTKIEVITSETEWGKQVEAFGGIIGLLRYKIEGQ